MKIFIYDHNSLHNLSIYPLSLYVLSVVPMVSFWNFPLVLYYEIVDESLVSLNYGS